MLAPAPYRITAVGPTLRVAVMVVTAGVFLRAGTLASAATPGFVTSHSQRTASEISQCHSSVARAAPVFDSDFYNAGRPAPGKVELGRLLFFDKLLSGNRNIACATCHHPTLGSGDGVALSLGDGAVGLGAERHVVASAPVTGRVPRNAQSLVNLCAREFARLYHDGRVETDEDGPWSSGFWSPAREQLPDGLDNVLAAQALFPVLSPVETDGHKGENPVAVAIDRLAGPGGAWDLLAARPRDNDDYARRFVDNFDDVETPGDIRFVHAANAIAAFESTAFRSSDSRFDRYLRTRDEGVLGPAARRGMVLFDGRAGCSGCHSGKFLTDQRFHAIAMPQFGPRKGDGTNDAYWEHSGFRARVEDEGRYRETREPAARFRFRTPSLRNVAHTAPYGHAGSYAALHEAVPHHLAPRASLERSADTMPPLPPLGALACAGHCSQRPAGR